MLPAGEILSRLREIRLDILRGYPGALSWVAGNLTEADRRQIRPRYIATGAETLTRDMRRRISEGFGARVFDFYASFEFLLIASECPRSGLYHITEGTTIVEILEDGRPVKAGGTGELVATALHSYAMPFIRFQVGDTVTRGETGCPCGAPVATIVQIQGRTADRFLLPNGETLHPYALDQPLIDYAPWLRRYQVTQERKDLFRIKVVALSDSRPSPETLAGIGRRIAADIGHGVRVEIELVDEIPPGKGGKFRPYRSLVAP
jgi:phenylacetate-CoA ligase